MNDADQIFGGLSTIVLDALPVLVSYVDAERRYRFANRAYERWFGRTLEEIRGRTMWDVLGRAAYERLRPYADAAMAGEPVEYEQELPYSSGGARWVHARYLPHRGPTGGVVGFVVLVEDVSERHRHQEELRAAHERTVAALESITDCFYTVDREARFTFVNDHAERWFGRPRAELLGRVPWEVFPEAAESLRRFVGSGLAGQPVHEERISDVSHRWIELHAYPSTDGVSVVFRDIHDRKQLQEAVRRAEQLQAVGKLAGGMAHEINNQMTVIQGFGALLARALTPGSLEATRVGHVLEAAQRTARLTRELLAFSRRQALQPVVMELNTAIAEAAPVLEQVLGPGGSLRLDLSPSPWHVLADRTQLGQVLINLVANAHDAMPHGGVVTIRVRGGGERAAFEVTDTGAGMTPEVASRAFEPFFTTKVVGQGTGLGLATVYGIVAQSGGRVSLESEVGRGTTVIVELPVVEAPAVGEGSAAATPDGSGEAPRSLDAGPLVLVVEDEPTLRELFRDALTAAGYRVAVAADGVEAVEVVERRADTIRLVVTDLTMPRMGGRELARYVRAHQDSPVLFISGHAGPQAVQQGILEPDEELLQKPFTPEDLVSRVRALVPLPER